MSLRIPPWLNENANRQYPFKEDADLTSIGDKSIRLFNDIILDFKVTITKPDFVPPAEAYRLSVLHISNGTAKFYFALGNNLSITITTPDTIDQYFTITGFISEVYYTLTVGEGVNRWRDTYGTTPIAFGVTDIEPTRIHISNTNRVNSIQGGDAGEVLSGKIYLDDGYNCRPIVTKNSIHLTAGKGIGAGRYCDPLEDIGTTCGEALLSINGQTASSDGNINLAVHGMELTVDEHNPSKLIIKLPDKLYDNMGCG